MGLCTIPRMFGAKRGIAAATCVLMLAGCGSAPADWTFAPRPSVLATPPAPAPATPAATADATPVPATPAATSGSNFQTVTSPMHRWTVEVPAAWPLRPATEVWLPNTYPLAGARYTDNMESPGGFPVFDVSVQQLPSGQTEDDFLAFMTAENEAHGYEVVESEEIVVDEVTGRIQRQSFGGEGIWEVILHKDGRAYVIYWVDLETQLDENEALFRRIIDSFRFPD